MGHNEILNEYNVDTDVDVDGASGHGAWLLVVQFGLCLTFPVGAFPG